MEKTCSKPNCLKTPQGRGMCATHYSRWARSNPDQLDPSKSKWVNPDGSRMSCDVDGCESLAHTCGMCQRHYQNFHYESTRGLTKTRKNRKHRDVNNAPIERFCTFEGCSNVEFNPGLCAGHYYQRNRGEGLTPLHERAACPVNGCDGDYSVKLSKSNLCANCQSFCRRFSMTPAQVIALFENRVCSNPGCDSTENLHVDHDHSCCPRTSSGSKSCGKCVRGLLCRSCNLGLGTLQEDPRRIEGLLRYLERFTR